MEKQLFTLLFLSLFFTQLSCSAFENITNKALEHGPSVVVSVGGAATLLTDDPTLKAATRAAIAPIKNYAANDKGSRPEESWFKLRVFKTCCNVSFAASRASYHWYNGTLTPETATRIAVGTVPSLLSIWLGDQIIPGTNTPVYQLCGAFETGMHIGDLHDELVKAF